MEIPKKVQVAIFLQEFKKVATQEGGLYVINREKNRDSLVAMGLTKHNREEAILSLEAIDYYAGPKKDRDREGSIWEFGQSIDGTEIYMKLKIAEISGKRIAKCISFHKAEFKLNYPLR